MATKKPTSELVKGNAVEHALRYQQKLGLAFRTAVYGPNQIVQYVEGYEKDGSPILGKPLKLFCSCSYMGMSFNKHAIDAMTAAAKQSGLDVRGPAFWAHSPYHDELARLLGEIFGAKVFVCVSTKNASESFMCACVGPDDRVVVERGRTHGTVLLGCEMAGKHPVCVSLASDRATALAQIADAARAAKSDGGRVWYCTDSIDSATGACFTPADYNAVLDVDECVNLYVDDAHGVFTTGKHGCGIFLRDMPFASNPRRARVCVAGSLDKAFGCEGGFVACGDPAMYEAMLYRSMPHYFSSGVKAPLAAAGIELAKYFLSPECDAAFDRLDHLSRDVQARLGEAGINTQSTPEAPLKTVNFGQLDAACDFALDMRKHGFEVFIMTYPGASLGHASIRFMLNAEHTDADIDAFVAAFIKCCPHDLPAPGVRVRDPAYDNIPDYSALRIATSHHEAM